MATKFDENSSAVQSHLNILQSVIQRMANNSSSSKAWCITLVSAILVLVAEKSKSDFAWIAVIPTILFFCLDGYYLAMEKGFRESYNEFIKKLHSSDVTSEDLYAVAPSGCDMTHLFLSLISFSVLPFYLMLGLMIILVKLMIL